ncbi:16S rRNA (guanine(966)-N(2))-methyltransferase RsmD [Granulosicoccus sp. 3-233]|uniref:16S rRNA (guanine(966)-N(2))-methyltransferase RsmD n=1 Tax=Granulosicoccus sp. 3-233 TaxID=3417969 RepID=UPI003D32CE78
MTPPSNRSRNPRQGKSDRKGNRNSAGQVRIIAGEWRGRKLAVADVEGLRPTGDRVRETLFNWLQPLVAGSRCLDLFAGSGALGYEALSRHATSVTLVEPNGRAHAVLQQSAEVLGVPKSRARLVQGSAEQFLSGNRDRYDIVFIDPPFDYELQWDTLAVLASGHVTDNAHVYIESPTVQAMPEQLPGGFCVHREKVFGDVHARLLARKDIM